MSKKNKKRNDEQFHCSILETLLNYHSENRYTEAELDEIGEYYQQLINKICR